MRHTTIAALAGLAVLTAPLAAQTQYNARVAQAMNPGGKYIAPICPLKGGDFRTSSAGLYLKTATEGFKDQSIGVSQVSTLTYNEGLKKALNSAKEAVANNPNNAAGWYYLARASIQLGDLTGADTAFTRLEALSPDCGPSEIKGMRQKAWLVLVNPSAEFLKNKQFDSALTVLRDANTIARYYPQGFYNLGATFANMTPAQPDSAIYYFKIAADKAATDPSLAETLKSTTYNLGFLYQQMGDNPNAIASYKKYLVLDPTNDLVKRSLITLLRATGTAANNAEASQLDGERKAAGKMSSSELASEGVRLFNEKNYAGAVDAFKSVLATDPNNHDAAFNLANAYYALGDAKNLIDASKSVLVTDPLNQLNIKLLANGYRLVADTAKQLDAVIMLSAMVTTVAVERFTVKADSAVINGTATGNEGTTASGKTIPPSAVTLVFEFIDAIGVVVASQDVAIPALATNAKAPIAVAVAGKGITGWKYHKK